MTGNTGYGPAGTNEYNLIQPLLRILLLHISMMITIKNLKLSDIPQSSVIQGMTQTGRNFGGLTAKISMKNKSVGCSIPLDWASLNDPNR